MPVSAASARAETLFICATDEHGTPAELAAAEAGMTSRRLLRAAACGAARPTYRRLNLSFDHFGRSSSARESRADAAFLRRRLEEQRFHRGAERAADLFSVADNRFLPDRYVVGTCPHCGSDRARGDQCEACTRPLDPTDLIAPRSAISGTTELELRPSRHLFLRQSALEGELRGWIAIALRTGRRSSPRLRRNGSTKAFATAASRVICLGRAGAEAGIRRQGILCLVRCADCLHRGDAGLGG